ncbi:MAG: cyclic pyranopterin monophosphate synthase MoaC [Acidimicrobiia bacterium]
MSGDFPVPGPPPEGEGAHLDRAGRVRMVDVGDKPETERRAEAEALVRMAPATREALFGGDLPKGDALATARLAGIMAAKRTSELIPLCHPLPLDGVSVEVEEAERGARVVARASTNARTGVEMEAMTAAAVAALTIYDMVKGLERGVEVGPVRLLRKEGGKSGPWSR